MAGPAPSSDADHGVRRATAGLLLLDLGLHLLLLAWCAAGLAGAPGPGAVAPWGPPAAAGYALLVLLADAGCLARNGNANVWRRRLALVPVVAVLWRPGPFFALAVQIPAVGWAGALWIALLLQAGRDAQAHAPPGG